MRFLRKLNVCSKSKIRLFVNKKPFYLRIGSSDVSVFEQIFIDEEFSFINKYSIKKIVDLGANIGVSACYFSMIFPDAEIHCVEPDRGNFEMLKINTSAIKNLRLKCGAILGETGSATLSNKVSKNNEWGYQFKIDKKGKVACYSFPDFLKNNQIDNADLLKIDVEGAEFEIIKNISDEDLKRFKIITIEIHCKEKNNNEIVERMTKVGWKNEIIGELTVFTS